MVAGGRACQGACLISSQCETIEKTHRFFLAKNEARPLPPATYSRGVGKSAKFGDARMGTAGPVKGHAPFLLSAKKLNQFFLPCEKWGMPLATRRLPLKAFAFIMISTFLLSEGALVADAWKEQKGDHFIVYYQNDENFAKQVTRHSEMYYTQIANELGYARHSNFWQWENRVKIYIHPTAEEFRRVTGEKEWSVGMASYFKKEIHTFSNSEGFMDGILPHEITHLIFRDFVGTQGAIPMWVDEGVAQYMEPQKRKLAKSYAQYLIKIDKEFPLYDLMRTNVRKYTDPEKVNAFYMQSVSLIDYLISRYGAQSFTQFCRELRDGKGFDDSLRAAYPNYIESVPDLEQKWRKYVALNQEEGAAKVLTAK